MEGFTHGDYDIFPGAKLIDVEGMPIKWMACATAIRKSGNANSVDWDKFPVFDTEKEACLFAATTIKNMIDTGEISI